ncbi:MAG: hypothetical protein Tsb0021_17790 [Chlamydiales bacterium]
MLISLFFLLSSCSRNLSRFQREYIDEIGIERIYYSDQLAVAPPLAFESVITENGSFYYLVIDGIPLKTEKTLINYSSGEYTKSCQGTVLLGGQKVLFPEADGKELCQWIASGSKVEISTAGYHIIIPSKEDSFLQGNLGSNLIMLLESL